MVRSRKSERKRNIYLAAQCIKNITENNEYHVKYINTGVKVLARSEHEQCPCNYRLVQEVSRPCS